MERSFLLYVVLAIDSMDEMKSKSLFWILLPSFSLFMLLGMAIIIFLSIEPDLGYTNLAINEMILALALVFVLSSIGSWLIAGWFGQAVERIIHGITRVAFNNFEEQIEVQPIKEFDLISGHVNQLMKNLGAHFNNHGVNQLEGETVLFSIKDGVLALDQNMNLLKANPRALELLNIKSTDVEGRAFFDVCNDIELKQFINSGQRFQSAEAEISLCGGIMGLEIEVVRSPLYNPDGFIRGTVIVLRDITRLKQLENQRKEFAANVSHELKTPLTAIKGFVENLADGAMDDPTVAKKFIGIITRHVNRLIAIIDDLLSLSLMENTETVKKAGGELFSVKKLISNAVAMLENKIKNNDLKLEITSSEEIITVMNSSMMEQALVNLLDNAINYSPRGERVLVTTKLNGDTVSIIIRDYGKGIHKSHFDRLFERFYRVDAARSREMGGTGLGLSIVKHVAQFHGGRVSVDSALGEGSTFAIHFPFHNESVRA